MRQVMSNIRFKDLRKVVCAACRNNETGLIVCAPRHFDPIMLAQIAALNDDWNYKELEQGFINNFGVFLTWREAYFVALNAEQIQRDDGNELLISEMLY